MTDTWMTHTCRRLTHADDGLTHADDRLTHTQLTHTCRLTLTCGWQTWGLTHVDDWQTYRWLTHTWTTDTSGLTHADDWLTHGWLTHANDWHTWTDTWMTDSHVQMTGLWQWYSQFYVERMVFSTNGTELGIHKRKKKKKGSIYTSHHIQKSTITKRRPKWKPPNHKTRIRKCGRISLGSQIRQWFLKQNAKTGSS